MVDRTLKSNYYYYLVQSSLLTSMYGLLLLSDSDSSCCILIKSIQLGFLWGEKFTDPSWFADVCKSVPSQK